MCLNEQLVNCNGQTLHQLQKLWCRLPWFMIHKTTQAKHFLIWFKIYLNQIKSQKISFPFSYLGGFSTTESLLVRAQNRLCPSGWHRVRHRVGHNVPRQHRTTRCSERSARHCTRACHNAHMSQKHTMERLRPHSLWVTGDHKAPAGSRYIIMCDMSGCMCVTRRRGRRRRCTGWFHIHAKHCSVHMETFSAAASVLVSGAMWELAARCCVYFSTSGRTTSHTTDLYRAEKLSGTIAADCSKRAERRLRGSHLTHTQLR